MNKKIANAWTRWHPFNPLLRTEKQIEEFYANYKDATWKKIQDPTTEEGDLVIDRRRNMKILTNEYKCKNCGELFPTEERAMAHIKAVKRLKREEESKIDPNEITIVEKATPITDALVIYEIVRSEEFLDLPKSIEWDPYKPQGPFKVPTPQDREKHDAEMKQWRKDMKSTEGQRTTKLHILPNEDIQEQGGRSWWYFCPEKWEGNRWKPISSLELKTFQQGKKIYAKDLPSYLLPTKIRARVLLLLAIIPLEKRAKIEDLHQVS